MDYATNREISNLQAAVTGLSERLTKLEAHAGFVLADPGTEQTNETACVGETAATEQTASFDSYANNSEEKAKEADQENAKAKEVQGKTEADDRCDDEAKTKFSDNLETKIGLYWLNRIGIVTLVLGVVLLIGYSYQFFGPAIKIAIGFLTAAVLLYFSEHFEKTKGMTWYGRSLAGGGWSVAYFTVFAMHHVQSINLIKSAAVDLLLLLGVAGCALTHAVRRKSEMMSILSLVLGFGTLFFSHIDMYSTLASAILLSALGYLVISQKWIKLLGAGVLVAYISFLGSPVGENWANSTLRIEIPGMVQPLTDHFQLQLSVVFSVMYWLAFSIMVIGLGEKFAKNRLVVASIVGNTIAFCVLAGGALSILYPSQMYIFWFAKGTIDSIMSYFAERAKMTGIARFLATVGVLTSTFAVPMKLKPEFTSVVWAIEVVLLACLGRIWKYAVLEVLAVLIGVFTLPRMLGLVSDYPSAIRQGVLSTGLVAGTIGSGCYFLAALLYRKEILDGKALKPYYCAHFTLMSLLSAALFTHEAPQAWMGGLVHTLALSALGQYWKDSTARIAGLVSAAFLSRIAVSEHGIDNSVSVLVAAVLLGVSWLMRHLDGIGRRMRNWLVYGHYGLFFLVGAYVIHAYVEEPWLVPVHASSALLLLLWGRHLNDSVIRSSAYIAFLLSVLSVYGQFGNWLWLPNLSVVVALYIAWVLQWKGASEKEWDKPMGVVLCSLGTVLLTSTIGSLQTTQLISLTFAVEGAMLLIAGFMVKCKHLRVSGLILFTLLMARLLFVDLAGAETVQRILSFIVAGLVLLAGSYGYALSQRKVQEG